MSTPTITSTDVPSVANMPRTERDALAIWLSQALIAVGIKDRRQRIAMQGQLANLIKW